MKKFGRKIIAFFIILFIIVYLKPLFLLVNNQYKQTVAGAGIYLSIDKSKKRTKSKKLLIGDSVGWQLFSNNIENDTINSLTCNQAISVVGHYLLLNNYLNSGNKPKEVYLLYSPFSFYNNLNEVYTFHYFLKPFYNKEYADQLSNTVINQIEKIPYSWICREPYILTSNWAPDYSCKDKIDYSFLSPISREYLGKIKNLCQLHNIKFFIIPTPTKESRKKEIMNYNKDEISDLNVEKELTYFLEHIIYLPDSFYLDDVHFKKPELLRDSVLMEMEKALQSDTI